MEMVVSGMESLRGSIFGFKLIKEEKLVEEFRMYEKRGILEFIGGWNGKWRFSKREGRLIKVIVNKERLERNGMEKEDSYYKFEEGKYLDSYDFVKIKEIKNKIRLGRVEVWDRVDRLVEESKLEREKREKRADRKLEKLRKLGW